LTPEPTRLGEVLWLEPYPDLLLEGLAGRNQGTTAGARLAVEADLIARRTRAYDSGDVDGVVALLTDDVWVRMPPVPLEYQGRELAARFLAAVSFRQGRTYRLVATRANGQPAFDAYVRNPRAGVQPAIGLLVCTLAGERICTMTLFDKSVLARFGLPPNPTRLSTP